MKNRSKTFAYILITFLCAILLLPIYICIIACRLVSAILVFPASLISGYGINDSCQNFLDELNLQI